jgi:hypothetical protein
MLATTCPQCSNTLEIETKYVGKNVLCPFCQQLFVPPQPHSGLGLASLGLAGGALLIELFALVYFLSGGAWHTGFLSAERVRTIMVFIRFIGLILSWMGVACGILGMMKKRRRTDAAKWGLIANIVLDVFVCGYLIVSPAPPVPPPPPPPPPVDPSDS